MAPGSSALPGRGPATRTSATASQLLELAASKVADFTALDHPGARSAHEGSAKAAMEAGTASAAAEGLRDVLGEQTERADGLQADLARERSSSAKLQAAERKLQVQSCSCTRTPSPPPTHNSGPTTHIQTHLYLASAPPTSPVHPSPRQCTPHHPPPANHRDAGAAARADRCGGGGGAARGGE